MYSRTCELERRDVAGRGPASADMPADGSHPARPTQGDSAVQGAEPAASHLEDGNGQAGEPATQPEEEDAGRAMVQVGPVFWGARDDNLEEDPFLQSSRRRFGALHYRVSRRWARMATPIQWRICRGGSSTCGFSTVLLAWSTIRGA